MTNEKALLAAKQGLIVYETQYPQLTEQIKFQKVVISALEKQIPKKPIGGVKAAGICPNCGERFLMYQIGMRDFPTPHAFLFDYCLLCGQRIDWS